MNYHILDLYTLKSMRRDLTKEIKKTVDNLNKLREQVEIITMILKHRENSEDSEIINDGSLVNPL